MIALPPAKEALDRRFDTVRHQLRQACAAAGRPPVTLLAVSKGHPASAIRALAMRGQSAFGENYLQPALDKIAELHDLPLQWHYIGAIQSNKTRPIAEHFDWVQTVDRLKIANRLSEQRPATLPPLQVLLQVNIDDEPQKAGVTAAELPALAAAVLQLPNLTLRGIMGLPAATQNDTQRRASLARLNQLFQQLQPLSASIDTLSMGMSDDLALAIAEGSTMVRIGTALFGPRPANDNDH